MSISEKPHPLLSLLADGNFHSGSELAEQLGISRSAVWKQMALLEELGLPYAAVRGKGYKLDRLLEFLDAELIRPALKPDNQDLLQNLTIFQHIHSTNSYLADIGQQSPASGWACFAEQQTAGKGRRGRQWVSPFGSNIYLSVLWRYELIGPAGLSGLSLAVGVAVIRALKQCGVDGVGLKWPNDLICQGKKLGGILIEVSGESAGPCTAVIGLGLNVFLAPAEAAVIGQAWTDLAQLSAHVSRNQLAACLLDELLPVIAHFENTGLDAYLAEWRSYDCLKGQSAQLFIGNQQWAGEVLGIDDNGLLLFKKSDGSQQAYASGEVSFSSGNVA
ncbi:bifunctional biotin--[acetyl-CoA-carboxylase] ligase/biotin operon repressor BirA [Methylosoma difficile]